MILSKNVYIMLRTGCFWPCFVAVVVEINVKIKFVLVANVVAALSGVVVGDVVVDACVIVVIAADGVVAIKAHISSFSLCFVAAADGVDDAVAVLDVVVTVAAVA